MKQIICPDCGKIKQYGVSEQVRRVLYFDANDNPCGVSEDYCVYSGKVKRCPNCGRKVKIIGEVEE